MPRTYKIKNVHTSPQTAGRKNMTEAVIKTMGKDEDKLLTKILAIDKEGVRTNSIYKGKWTDEQFTESVNQFFEFCDEISFKPTQPALRVWLNVSRQTINEWRSKPEKYGVKSDIIDKAFNLMEMYLQGNIDKYPTGSIFLLKTSHGHIETSKVDVTSNGSQIQSKEDLDDAVSKLGLNK